MRDNQYSTQATVVDHALTEVNGKAVFKIKFSTDRGTVYYDGWLNSKDNAERAFKQINNLHRFGDLDEFVMNIESIDLRGKTAEVVIETEEYQGREQSKVVFINNALDKSKQKSLVASLQATLGLRTF